MIVDKLKDLAPVPLAAPESRQLVAARKRVIWAGGALAVLVGFFPILHALAGVYAVAAVVAAGVFAAIQVPIWARAKNVADDEYLFRDRGGDDAQD